MASVTVGTITANADEAAILDRQLTAVNEKRIEQQIAPYPNRDVWFAREFSDTKVNELIADGRQEQEQRTAIAQLFNKASKEQVNAIMLILKPQ
jgi:hypothetical protein